MTFDEIRAAHPSLRLNLYAMTPGGLVTLEVIDPEEQIYTFVGETEAAALAQAFPPLPEPQESAPEPPAPMDGAFA